MLYLPFVVDLIWSVLAEPLSALVRKRCQMNAIFLHSSLPIISSRPQDIFLNFLFMCCDHYLDFIPLTATHTSSLNAVVRKQNVEKHRGLDHKQPQFKAVFPFDFQWP